VIAANALKLEQISLIEVSEIPNIVPDTGGILAVFYCSLSLSLFVGFR
jgi:hypothetical protein